MILLKYLFVTLLISIALVSSAAATDWTLCNGPYGGNVSCLAVKDSMIFAGTSPGDVYVSTNHGSEWKIFGSLLANNNFTALISSGSFIYVGP